jgi:hypothetical protein
MIPSAIGQVPLRLEVQLLTMAVTVISTIAIKNNFFIVFFWSLNLILQIMFCKDNLPNLNGEIVFILHCTVIKTEKRQNSA